MAYFIVLLGIVFRLIPHLPNATPMAAIALFCGTYLDKRTAFILPLVIMIASDLILGLHSLVLFTWGSYILIVLIGFWLKDYRTIINTIGSSFAGSLIFFTITNFGVWVIPASWYPHTIQGLINCYIMGLPFLRFTVLGDLTYVVILFGIYELAQAAAKRLISLKYSI